MFIGKKIIKNASILIAETQVGVEEYFQLCSTLNRENIVVLSPPFDTDEYVTLPQRGETLEKNLIFTMMKKLLVSLGEFTTLKETIF